MKSLSMFNKPVSKADNKQGGLVFLEYVIIAFIIAFAVTCAVWWLYYHLQQMMWTIKDQLIRFENRASKCPLVKGGIYTGDQPLPSS